MRRPQRENSYTSAQQGKTCLPPLYDQSLGYVSLGAFKIAHSLENETIIALMIFLELENFSVMIALISGHKILN